MRFNVKMDELVLNLHGVLYLIRELSKRQI